MSLNISDEEAMRALLSSAQAREGERNEQGKQNKQQQPRNNKRWGDHHHQSSHATNQNRPSHKRTRREEDTTNNNNNRNDDSYYGPASGRETAAENYNDDSKNEQEDKPPPEQKANFGLSGALAKDEGGGGNIYKGVVLKFREPPEARCPNTQWRLYVFKGKDLVDTLHIAKQSAYLIGRNTDIADIPMAHPSLSSQHAVLQYRALPTDDGRMSCQPYIIDLESTNGTFLNGVRIDSARYYQIKKGDVLKFGASTREYVLMKAEGNKL